MTAVDPRKAKFSKRCPRCGYDEWHVMRQHRQCAKCKWKEITVMPVPANAFYNWKPRPPMCKLCGAAIIGILVNDPAAEYCAGCRQAVPKPGREGSDLDAPDMQDFADQVSKILPRNPNGRAAEQLRQAIREAKDEKIIRIPPQPEEATIRFSSSDLREPTPHFVPSTAWADNGSNPLEDVRKMTEAMLKSMGIPKHILEGTEPPVFCGTTGDKDHVKEKALSEPIGLGLPGRICVRCSRLCGGRFDGEWVCPTCGMIERNDAPLACHLPKDEATSLWLKIDHERAKLANARALLENA